MSISRRDDIIKNIISVLGAMDIAGGFNWDSYDIKEKLFNPDSTQDFPAIAVFDSDETKNDADLSELQNILNIAVVGYVKQIDDTNNVREDCRKLMRDIEKAICADRYRGGVAINTVCTSIKTDHGFNDPYGMCELIFRVNYLQDYGTP